MNWIALIENLFASSSSGQSKGESVLAESIDFLRLLNSAGSALSAQAALHSQLARVEWEEEKNRLLQMTIMLLVGFACGLCLMIFAGALVLAFSWETGYRIHAIVGLIIVYGIGIAFAYSCFKSLAARSNQVFAATREELAADIALIKSKL